MQIRKFLLRALPFAGAALVSASLAQAAAFGNVVTTVGGHPSDIALDESRGRLYIANFTALRVDVMNTADRTLKTPMALSSHPGALAVSPDAGYLVVTEYQNGTSVPQGWNGLTIINLNTGSQQNLTTADPALSVAFGRTGQALVATSKGFFLLDPSTGNLQFLIAFPTLASLTLPVGQATFPPQILETQMTSSADGLWIWGVAVPGTSSDTAPTAASTTQIIFRFNVLTSHFNAQLWTTAPALLPRVSVAADGSWAMIGWSMFAPSNCDDGFMIPARYPQPVGSSTITGHAVTAKNGVTDTIYAQIFDSTQPVGPPYYSGTPATPGSSPKYPTLSIMDADNLTVRDKIYLPENLMGRAILDSAGNNMYAISDSGVTVLPLGSLNRFSRVAASQEDLLVQTNFCNRNPLTATFRLSDPGNNGTDFTITSSQAGVLVSPSSGKTPATITVTVQPDAIPNPGGTLAVPLTIFSNGSINVPPSVRLLISNPDPDQRGAIVNVPGKLVDILPDVARNRFYVMRQDKNQVLVFDGSSNQQMATLRTGTTPTGMTVSGDGKYLMVASTDTQLIGVYDLDAVNAQMPVLPQWWSSTGRDSMQRPIQLPGSHYGRAIAQATNSALGPAFAVIENDGVADCPGGVSCAVDRMDFSTRCAYSPAALGIYKNDASAILKTSVLSSAPDGSSILLAAPNGNVMLYSVDGDTFVLSRKDLTSLSGAYAVSASPDASAIGPAFSTRYVIGDNVFDASLVPQGTLDTSVGHTYGFTFNGAGGYRLTGSTASGVGIIQNLADVTQASSSRPTRTVEAPVLTSGTTGFTRTVAPLSNGIALLTTSGVTVLPPNYDAAVAPPVVSAVVSAADGSQPVAPGELVSIYGQQLSPSSIGTSQLPLPTALAGSCLTVNGVPVPLMFVSNNQINAQLPFNTGGNATVVVRTPGGKSDAFNVTLSSGAPSVFRTGSAGPVNGLATVVRVTNNELVTDSNPVHPNDVLTIYLTGLGQTSPAIVAGVASPADPLSSANLKPTVALGGVNLGVDFAGLSPGMVGVYQINVRVPLSGVPTGFGIPLTISQGGVQTSLNVRVLN